MAASKRIALWVLTVLLAALSFPFLQAGWRGYRAEDSFMLFFGAIFLLSAIAIYWHKLRIGRAS